MERRIIVRYEFVMSEAEFNIFNLVCDSDKYAYGYYINALEQYIVSMNREVLYRVERALEIYMSDFDFDYENERREITTEEFEFYDSVKELYDDLTDERNEEEW
jgi:hypothetical protein